MSTFQGVIKEYPLISVDRFEKDNLQSTAFFLSHCHSDHMRGLNSREFITMLKSRKFSRVYVSEISRRLLANDYRYQDLLPFLESILLEEDTYIGLYNQAGELVYYVAVTLLPAGHCPGSVMFLFEGPNGTILYTGDFRLHCGSTSRLKPLHYPDGRTILNDQEGSGPADEGFGYIAISVKTIQSLYLDTTFCDEKSLHIPSRQECMDALFSLMEPWIKLAHCNHVYLITPAKYGYEAVFVSIYEKTGMKVHVTTDKFGSYIGVPEILEAVTTDASCTRIHCCSQSLPPGHREIALKTLPCAIKFKTPGDVKIRYIKLCAMFFTLYPSVTDIVQFDESKGLYRVCFSTHSSLSELIDMTKYLKPLAIFPNVVPAVSSVDEVMKPLNKAMIDQNSKKCSNLTDLPPLGVLKTTEKKAVPQDSGNGNTADFLFSLPFSQDINSTVAEEKEGFDKMNYIHSTSSINQPTHSSTNDNSKDDDLLCAPLVIDESRDTDDDLLWNYPPLVIDESRDPDDNPASSSSQSSQNYRTSESDQGLSSSLHLSSDECNTPLGSMKPSPSADVEHRSPNNLTELPCKNLHPVPTTVPTTAGTEVWRPFHFSGRSKMQNSTKATCYLTSGSSSLRLTTSLSNSSNQTNRDLPLKDLSSERGQNEFIRSPIKSPYIPVRRDAGIFNSNSTHDINPLCSNLLPDSIPVSSNSTDISLRSDAGVFGNNSTPGVYSSCSDLLLGNIPVYRKVNTFVPQRGGASISGGNLIYDVYSLDTTLLPGNVPLPSEVYTNPVDTSIYNGNLQNSPKTTYNSSSDSSVHSTKQKPPPFTGKSVPLNMPSSLPYIPVIKRSEGNGTLTTGAHSSCSNQQPGNFPVSYSSEVNKNPVGTLKYNKDVQNSTAAIQNSTSGSSSLHLTSEESPLLQLLHSRNNTMPTNMPTSLINIPFTNCSVGSKTSVSGPYSSCTNLIPGNIPVSHCCEMCNSPIGTSKYNGNLQNSTKATCYLTSGSSSLRLTSEESPPAQVLCTKNNNIPPYMPSSIINVPFINNPNDNIPVSCSSEVYNNAMHNSTSDSFFSHMSEESRPVQLLSTRENGRPLNMPPSLINVPFTNCLAGNEALGSLHSCLSDVLPDNDPVHDISSSCNKTVASSQASSIHEGQFLSKKKFDTVCESDHGRSCSICLSSDESFGRENENSDHSPSLIDGNSFFVECTPKFTVGKPCNAGTFLGGADLPQEKVPTAVVGNTSFCEPPGTSSQHTFESTLQFLSNFLEGRKRKTSNEMNLNLPIPVIKKPKNNDFLNTSNSTAIPAASNMAASCGLVTQFNPNSSQRYSDVTSCSSPGSRADVKAPISRKCKDGPSYKDNGENQNTGSDSSVLLNVQNRKNTLSSGQMIQSQNLSHSAAGNEMELTEDLQESLLSALFDLLDPSEVQEFLSSLPSDEAFGYLDVSVPKSCNTDNELKSTGSDVTCADEDAVPESQEYVTIYEQPSLLGKCEGFENMSPVLSEGRQYHSVGNIPYSDSRDPDVIIDDSGSTEEYNSEVYNSLDSSICEVSSSCSSPVLPVTADRTTTGLKNPCVSTVMSARNDTEDAISLSSDITSSSPCSESLIRDFPSEVSAALEVLNDTLVIDLSSDSDETL